MAAGTATTAAGALNRIPPDSKSADSRSIDSLSTASIAPANTNGANASAAQVNVVSELVTTNAGGAVTTLTTYQDGHETARTSFPRFTSTGALHDTGNERGQLINILV
jgi:hypothetical protein